MQLFKNDEMVIVGLIFISLTITCNIWIITKIVQALRSMNKVKSNQSNDDNNLTV